MHPFVILSARQMTKGCFIMKQNQKPMPPAHRRHPRYRRRRRSLILPNPLFLLLPVIIGLLAVGVKADQKVAELEKPVTTTEKIHLFFDRTPPEISGTKDLYTYAGETISYREGITVTDNLDASPLLTVDSSAVDLSTPGEYEAVYTAKDASGNKTKQEITVTVLQKEEGFVDMPRSVMQLTLSLIKY